MYPTCTAVEGGDAHDVIVTQGLMPTNQVLEPRVKGLEGGSVILTEHLKQQEGSSNIYVPAINTTLCVQLNGHVCHFKIKVQLHCYFR